MVFGSVVPHKNEKDHENQEENIHVGHALIHPKKPRNPRIPYPEDAEIIALSPTTLMAKNRFICEICFKGFPREQNLQLHKRGHNLPWKLRSTKKDDHAEVKRKVYICPEPSCIHHNRSHSLGDLTGIKKHYSRKHGERKYKCLKCTKMYAVQSDLKAHTKTCGNKDYQCHCGALFSRHDSFISHRAFCDSLADGGLFKHPTTVSSFSKSIQMSESFGTHVPSIQNLIHTSPAIAVGKRVAQLGQTSENQYKCQQNFDTTHHSFMGTNGYYGNGEGPSMFSGAHNAAVMTPQLSATALLHKASLIGSTWSRDDGANSFAPGYATCYASDPITMLKLNVGATYDQQVDRYHGGVHNCNRGFEDEWKSERLDQSLSNMDCQQSNAATFTRDFLGVGGGINISSDGPESTFVRQSVL